MEEDTETMETSRREEEMKNSSNRRRRRRKWDLGSGAKSDVEGFQGSKRGSFHAVDTHITMASS